MSHHLTNEPTRIFAARWIVPISREPIHGGWIRLAGQRVVEFGSGKPPRAADDVDFLDLGDVAVLPGLVNTHTHLEFSDCQQPIGQPGVALHDWIGHVIEARRSDNSHVNKQHTIAQGIAESLAAGVRLIGEITTPPCDYELSDSIELISFAEVLGLTQQRGDERLAAAELHHAQCDYAAWSPHAPYSTARHLIESCVAKSNASSRPLAMHVAESPAERELVTAGSGPFADVLRRLGVWQDDLFPWGTDPFVSLIGTLAKAPRALLVHGNDLRDHEIDQIAQHDHLSVVMCPRTHAFFGHAKHPVDRLLLAGVRVALGTDSRASNPDLNLWREIQFLLNHRTDLSPSGVLAMGTLNGAEALGRSDLGRIERGCRPGLASVQSTAPSEQALYADLATADYVPIQLND